MGVGVLWRNVALSLKETKQVEDVGEAGEDRQAVKLEQDYLTEDVTPRVKQKP